MTAQQYRKKPVVIEAMQFTRDADVNEADDGLFAWLDAERPDYWYDPDTNEIVIPTLEGDMRASVGDWIIRGVAGEFYPCKPDIFEATYEPVGPGHNMKTPDRANLHAACDLIREMFDGDPARANEIINDRMGPFNPAGDFIVALLTVAINAFSPYPAPARQKRIEGIRKIADALPADGKVKANGGAA